MTNCQSWVRMEWRACSPDLNPTETLLDQLGSARVTNTTMVARLILVEDAIPQQCVTKLVTSMRRMCQALVAFCFPHRFLLIFDFCNR
uniref:Tc1-like transposase DDE domain-containing protein n=1 Tax=Pundamilia nyererei TaxID=303518 RepID=A0A3B4G3E2_9CICH